MQWTLQKFAVVVNSIFNVYVIILNKFYCKIYITLIFVIEMLWVFWNTNVVCPGHHIEKSASPECCISAGGFYPTQSYRAGVSSSWIHGNHSEEKIATG